MNKIMVMVQNVIMVMINKLIYLYYIIRSIPHLFRLCFLFIETCFYLNGGQIIILYKYYYLFCGLLSVGIIIALSNLLGSKNLQTIILVIDICYYSYYLYSKYNRNGLNGLNNRNGLNGLNGRDIQIICRHEIIVVNYGNKGF